MKAKQEETIGTKEAAAILGVTPMALRRYLRSLPEHRDGKHTRYSWKDENDPKLKALAAGLEKHKRQGKAKPKAKAKKKAASK